VERRVEDGHVRHVRQCCSRDLDRLHRGFHVQRRELDEVGQFVNDSVVDQGRRRKALTAVDDAMADGGDGWDVFER
jgi:hypothetical protein